MTILRGDLFDERTVPDLRDRFGQLARESTELAVAVRRIRLTGVDLGVEEMASLGRIRVLLSELNAEVFGTEADCVMLNPERRATAERLGKLLASGVLEVRVAPMAVWTPDFSVFGKAAQPHAVIFGVHWFQRPYPHVGPAFATVHGPDGAARAAARFEELWEIAHDVTEAIEGLLLAARERTLEPTTV